MKTLPIIFNASKRRQKFAKFKHKLRKACSIKLLLMMGFVLQAVIPVCIIIVVTAVKQQQTTLSHSQDVANLLRKRVRDDVNAFMDTVIREASQVWFHNQHQLFDPYNLTQAQRILYPSIKYSNISSIYYTRLERDLYVGYGWYCDCANASFHFQYAIDQRYYDQPVGNLVTGHTALTWPSPPTNFSLRREEWHIKAVKHRTPSFSEPFYLSSLEWTAEPTAWISCVLPITNPSNASQVIGITNADYTLDKINDFLDALNLSRNSAVYIVDSEKGYMIASSDKNERLYRVQNNTLVMMPLSKSNKPIIGYVGAMLELEYGTRYSSVKSRIFNIDNYTLLVDPIQITKLNTRWTVLVMISVSDYVGPAVSLQEAIIIVDIIVLVVAALLGFVFAMLITRPLSSMTSRMRKNVFFNTPQVAKRNNKGTRRKSLLYEVSTLQTNFAKMENAVNGFMKYVPREIVLNFINHPTQQKFFQPGVEPADIAIMFTDVEEFTSISEKLQPDVLIKILTEYLEAISRAIGEHGGTLDKYIGDAVMALFNCPEKLDDYVTKACTCALVIRDITAKLNVTNQSIGLPAFHTRIGIHTGSCLVGNIGSSYRLSYTAMGDAVNLASRLESLNKYYGSYLLISKDCYDVVKEKILCRVLDKVAVKGRTQGIIIYEMINLKEKATEQEVEFVHEYNSIMALYFDKNFAAAFGEVLKFERKYPYDKAAKAMKQRIPDFIQEPPPQDWDGCTVMHEK